MAEVKRGLKAGSGRQLLRGANAGSLAGFSVGAVYTIFAGLSGYFLLGFFFPLIYGGVGLVVGGLVSFFYENVRFSNTLFKNVILAIPVSLLVTVFTARTEGFVPVGEGFLWYPFLSVIGTNLYITLFISSFVTWFIFFHVFRFFWKTL